MEFLRRSSQSKASPAPRANCAYRRQRSASMFVHWRTGLARGCWIAPRAASTSPRSRHWVTNAANAFSTRSTKSGKAPARCKPCRAGCCTLRPVSFGITQLGPALADYLVRYPEVVVDVTLDDRFIDVVEEGFDLALRVGALKNSSLIARRLATVRFVLLRIPRLCRHRPCSDFYRGQGPCGRSPDRADARIPTG